MHSRILVTRKIARLRGFSHEPSTLWSITIAARSVSQGVSVFVTPGLTPRASKDSARSFPEIAPPMSFCSSCSSVSAAQSDALSQQISIAALKKQNDAAKAQGAAVVQLLQAAANISKAAGTGGGCDGVG